MIRRGFLLRVAGGLAALSPLRGLAQSDGTEETPRPAAAAPLRAPRATVTPDLLGWDAQQNRWGVNLKPAPEAAERPPIAVDATGGGIRLLRVWMAQGRVAGLAGVFYDNRDRGHSRLSDRQFPQLTHIDYDAELAEQNYDMGLGHQFLFPAPLIGNASLAITTGNFPRSLPRLAMTAPPGARDAFVGYVRNHLYVYPAHRDYRDDDVFPATLPYFVPSLGSSGSDRPFVAALLMALAAFRPETRARLEADGLIAPTLAMILRRGQSGVTDYLDPVAHPPVFDRERLGIETMMQVAQTIAPDAIPPMVRLQVEEEGFALQAGLSGESERLFDTPSAVARLWRSWRWRQQMVVSAARTGDPNGRPLQFHWLLLSGDPERVRIEPLDAARSRVRLTVHWHDGPVPNATGAAPGARVEIAAIAWNGAHYSAPAPISIAFPAHERRSYAMGPGGNVLLRDVDYDAASRRAAYDNAVWWTAGWRDAAVYDSRLRLVAWRRTFADGRTTTVTPDAPGAYRLETGHQQRRLDWTPPSQ